MLIENETPQEERGRPFGPARLCLFIDLKLSLLLSFPCDCSRPCDGCFHSHPRLPILCNYCYNGAGALPRRSPALESATRSSDVAERNSVSLPKSIRFYGRDVFAKLGLSDFGGHNYICQHFLYDCFGTRTVTACVDAWHIAM